MKLIGTVLVFIFSITFFSCKKDKGPEPIITPDPEPGYTIPSTYAFTNINYSGQTYRMQMLEEMVNYMKTGRTPNTIISSTALNNMFANNGSPFLNTTLNTCGKQLENKFFVLDVNIVKSFMDSVSAASTNSLNIVVSTTDNTRKYLLNSNGFDYTEIIEKLTMGAVFYYHAMETYICQAGVGNTVDNSTIVPGDGTLMEHHWDEGFGYLGVPTAFPSSTVGLQFYGEYLDEVGNTLGIKTSLMNAFIKGRAAISNKDYTTRNDMINEISLKWEKLIAGSIIHELNEAKANLSDNAIRNHVVSEARGFIMALKYKTAKLVTQTQIDGWINSLGTNNNTITLSAINLVIDDVANVYSLQSIKAIL